VKYIGNLYLNLQGKFQSRYNRTKLSGAVNAHLSTFYIVDRTYVLSNITENSQFFVDDTIVNSSVSFRCRSYSRKISRLMRLLRRVNIPTRHNVRVYAHCLYGQRSKVKAKETFCSVYKKGELLHYLCKTNLEVSTVRTKLK